MTHVRNAPEQAQHTFIVSAASEVNIEHICQEQREEAQPPDVFLVTSEQVAGQLLAVSLGFLEEGQQLACPGLPLVGAAFDPGWGFAQAVVGKRRDGSAEFQLPPLHFQDLANGDIWGYRLCILEDREVSLAIAQLTHIRAALSRLSRGIEVSNEVKITISPL